MALQVLTADGVKCMVELVQDKVDMLTCDIASTATTLGDSFRVLECRVDELERAISNAVANIIALQDAIRPVPDAPTENPKQKSDLEIFPQIEWDEDFLKLDNNMFLIDL